MEQETGTKLVRGNIIKETPLHSSTRMGTLGVLLSDARQHTSSCYGA